MEFQEFGKENSRKITKERRGNLPGILCFEVLKRQFWIMIRKKVRSNDDDRWTEKGISADALGHDVMIPPRFFDSIAPVLATGDEAYLLSPVLYDLTGFPPIDIFYGTKEVMIAYLPDIKEACAKYDVPLTIHIGEGMMHCWGAMEFVPEAKAVRQEYFKALR